MAVKSIEAWQTSTGQAFAKKAEAYHEEMIHLVNTRGITDKKSGLDIGAFDEAIKDQQFLVTALVEMRKGLDGRSDKKILQELDTLLVDSDKWLASATTLRAGMSNI